MHGYMYLFLAIIIEVYASIELKRSNGLSQLVPSLMTFIGYGIAFFFLAQSLIYLPMSVVFATWSGVGIATTVIASLLLFKEPVDKQTVFSLTLLLTGIFLLNFSS